jgi:hypothetical protein
MHDASRGDRVVESTVIAIGIVSVLAVVTLRKDFAGLAGPDTSRFSSPASPWLPSTSGRFSSDPASAPASETGSCSAT